MRFLRFLIFAREPSEDDLLFVQFWGVKCSALGLFSDISEISENTMFLNSGNRIFVAGSIANFINLRNLREKKTLGF